MFTNQLDLEITLFYFPKFIIYIYFEKIKLSVRHMFIVKRTGQNV